MYISDLKNEINVCESCVFFHKKECTWKPPNINKNQYCFFFQSKAGVEKKNTPTSDEAEFDS